MSVVALIVAWAAVVVFLAAVIVRFRMFAKTPMHVRWELYPVPHEGGGRAAYGGSYLESNEWWKKPRETSKGAELTAMGMEILFLVALKEHNKKLWFRSFPFHFGLYLCFGALGLIVVNAFIAAVSGPQYLFMGGFHDIVWMIASVVGVLGLALGLGGALGLLHRRLTDPALADFTTPADLFNLGLFIVVFTFAFVVVATGNGQGFELATYSFLTFSPDVMALGGGPDAMAMAKFTGVTNAMLPLISVILFSLLLAYIPMTHMSHFVAKYFSYHEIRWKDEPNLAGSDQEATIGATLQRKVSWAAPHIRSDGRKSWAEVATDPTKAEAKK